MGQRGKDVNIDWIVIENICARPPVIVNRIVCSSNCLLGLPEQVTLLVLKQVALA